MISKMDEYMFDLQGYLLLKGAVSGTLLADLNSALDAIPRVGPGQWYGDVQREDFEASRGIALQQTFEAGEPIETLIDHPAWIEHVRTFIGGQGACDCLHGYLFMDENFAAIRGPGDGSTMVVPGSHKSNLPHPQAGDTCTETSVDNGAGAVEVHTKAGDAILFVDAICHGSARRVNPGERRFIVYRYCSSGARFRLGYYPSEELPARLTPERRAIVKSFPFWPRVPNAMPGFTDAPPGFLADPPRVT